jgi:hypothetical protein
MSESPDEIFEGILARLYVDAEFRERFLRDPSGEGQILGLSAPQIETLAGIDRDDLALAARSFERKRRHKGQH